MSSVLEHFIVSSAVRPDRPVRAAIYVRISSDPTGEGLGVARQEEDCQALCARLGWDVARVYRDNDVSAYSGKTRPQWNQLLSDIAAGLIDAVACWHVDRLTRSPRELEEVIDLHDKRGISLATVTGELDLSSPTGRMLARMLGAAARHEAEHKAERQRRAGLQKAQAGKPHHSGTRGYGYARDGVTILPDEAKIITEAKTRVLAGESVRSVAGDLNQRGIPTGTGGQWSHITLRHVLYSGRISGRREYYGQIMTGQVWPAIITTEESDQLRALLAHRAGTPRGRAHSYLLSGILTCHLCGEKMRGRPHTAGPRYMCVKGPGLPGCGKIAVVAAPAETIARDMILTALDGPQFLAALLTAAGTGDTTAGELSARLTAIESRRAELAEAWAAGDISRREWLTARDRLTADADALTASLAATQHSRALAAFATMTGTVWDRWDTLTFGARRALIQATTDSIPVYPAPGRRWDPSRIGDPIWRA